MSYPILPHWKLKKDLDPEIMSRILKIGCWYDEEAGIWFADTTKKAQAARLVIKAHYARKAPGKQFRRSSRRTALTTGLARTARRSQKNYISADDKEQTRK